MGAFLKSETELKAEVERITDRDRKRLIKIALKSGFFDVTVKSAEIENMFDQFLSSMETPKLSQLYRTELKMKKAKSKASAEERKADARVKILLGSFLIAQFEHKPDLLANMKGDLNTFLGLHKNPTVVKNNKALLRNFL
jgi:hypothetical protein